MENRLGHVFFHARYAVTKLYMKKLCIIGLGNMGQAINDALCSKKLFEINGCDKDDDVNEKIKDCEIVLIAVKPQSFDELASQISFDLSDKLIISIMAGVSVKKINERFKASRVVRVMPNLPLKVGEAFSGWYANENVTDEDKGDVKNILQSFGTEVEVDNEDKIDAITALSGSGPAYYYFLNKALSIKAMALGFSQEEAKKIVRGTFFGASKLLKESGEDSDTLIQKITSKGGTTEAALKYMEEKGANKIIQEAVEKAYKRAKELNNN